MRAWSALSGIAQGIPRRLRAPSAKSWTATSSTPPCGGDSAARPRSAAESAGVSVPTVSKVLNGRSGVSDETRARVEELIHQHG